MIKAITVSTVCVDLLWHLLIFFMTQLFVWVVGSILRKFKKKNQQTAAPLRKTKFTYIVYDHSKLQSFVINFLIKIIVINMQGKLSYFFFRPAGVKLIKPWKYLCNVPGITLIYCTPNILTVVFFFLVGTRSSFHYRKHGLWQNLCWSFIISAH